MEASIPTVTRAARHSVAFARQMSAMRALVRNGPAQKAKRAELAQKQQTSRIERASSSGSASGSPSKSPKKPWNQSFIDFVSQLDGR
mmetsp:Transcript_14931/g.37972  ORF Transcript_14931/g.37972 Transcript_14931/m.37972 type:complete len:87 (+) Transcript_14931:119-379(+)